MHESFISRCNATVARLLILTVVILKLMARLVKPCGQNPIVP
jgi:hypothetical protein